MNIYKEYGDLDGYVRFWHKRASVTMMAEALGEGVATPVLLKAVRSSLRRQGLKANQNAGFKRDFSRGRKGGPQ